MDLKLTTRSQEALAAAVRRTSTDGHPQVEPAHLLDALLGQTDGVAPALLRAVQADIGPLRRAADRALAALPAASGASVASPQLGRATYAALSAAGEVARGLGDEYVSTEHLLVGLATDGGGVGRLLTARRRHRGRAARGVRARCGAAPGSPAPTPRAPTRRWRSTAST